RNLHLRIAAFATPEERAHLRRKGLQALFAAVTRSLLPPGKFQTAQPLCCRVGWRGCSVSMLEASGRTVTLVTNWRTREGNAAADRRYRSPAQKKKPAELAGFVVVESSIG